MRIGTWNCRLNIDGKLEALSRLRLDVAVVPESAARPMLATAPGVTHAWTGQIPSKGLGVFAFGDWTIRPVFEDDSLPWCLPVEVRHVDGAEMLLLAVWTAKREGDGRPTYAAQLTEVIERWRERIKSDHVVIAGDVNASMQGPSVDAHSRNLEALAGLGMHSSFQLANGPVPAHEEPPTLRWIGPGKKPYHYHCDFVFVSNRLAERVRSAEVGTLTDWVETGLSDHCPVVAELAFPG